MKKYTVSALSKLAGISVRALHLYDELGLLKPAFVGENGYRYYEASQLPRLQQILFFRELEFALSDIKKILDSPGFDPVAAIEKHKELLTLKKKRLSRLLKTVDETLTILKGGESVKTDDLFKGFNTDDIEAYKEEAKKRWGNTEAYKQSVERTKHWSKADYKRIAEEGVALTQELAEAMDKGATSPEFQALIAKHHKGIEVFYDCSWEMYRGLADLYITDPRFARYYDRVMPGLAQVVHDGIYYFCEQKEARASE